jgi:hypothetical protein
VAKWRVKRPGREAHHLPAPSVEVKKYMDLQLHSPVRLHVVMFNYALCHEDMWGSGGIAPPFLTSELDGGELSASSPGERAPRYRLDRSRDSSAGIATGYGLDGRGSIHGRDKIFLFSIAFRAALGPTKLPIQWVPGANSQGVKRQERESDYSPPSSAKVKNDGAMSLLPHTS